MKIFLSLLILSIVNVKIYSQEHFYSTREYATTISNNCVNTITKDQSGLLWVGTIDGLNSFDGLNWRRFYKEDGLPTNNVKTVVVDNNNIKWILANGVLTKFNDSSFVQYDNEYLSTRTINSVVADHNGNIWVTTNSGLLMVGNPKDSLFFPDVNVTNVFIDRNNHKLICGYYNDNKHGLTAFPINEYNDTIWKIRYTSAKPSGLERPYMGINGTSYFASDNKGYDWIKSDWYGFITSAPNKTTLRFTPPLWVDNEYNLYGNTEDGTFCKQINGVRILFQVPDLGGSVRALFQDKEQNIWIGSCGGLHKFDGKNWQTFNVTTNIRNTILDIKIDYKNNKWFNTGIELLKFDDNNWNLYKLGAINDFNIGHSNLVWYSPKQGGLFVLDLDKSYPYIYPYSYTIFVLDDYATIKNVYNKIYVGQVGSSKVPFRQVWVEDMTPGLSGTLLSISESNKIDTLGGGIIFKNWQDDIWKYVNIGPYKGLYYFKNDSFKLEKNLPDSLGVIISYAVDSKNQVWIVSSKYGLFKIKENELKSIRPDIITKKMFIDFQDNIWFLPNQNTNQFCKYLTEEDSVLYYQKDVWFSSLTIDFGGSLWLGSYEGIIQIENMAKTLYVLPKIMTFSAKDSSSQELEILSNCDWKLENNCDWIRTDFTDGSGNGIIKVKAETNNGTIERCCYLSVTSKHTVLQKIKIVQLNGEVNTQIDSINKKEKIIAYPNPVKNQYTVINNNLSTSIIEIFNLSGQLTYIGILKYGENNINLERLENGVYLVKFKAGIDVFYRKIIKIR